MINFKKRFLFFFIFLSFYLVELFLGLLGFGNTNLFNLNKGFANGNEGKYFLAVSWAQGVQNMEAIPGQSRTNDFVAYLEGLYKFGIAISAILAVFFISYGSFQYIVTSVGNAAKMEEAKKQIFNAIFGLIIALLAFLILFVVNPDLVKGILTGAPKIEEMVKKEETPSVGEACFSTSDTADFSNSGSTKPPSSCQQYQDLFKKYGSSLGGGYNGECILLAIAATESSCNPNAQSAAGSCGLMQLLPSTAGVSCEDLKKDPELSVKKAAEYISNNINSSCVSAAKDDLTAIFAGYNGGYGCSASACGSQKAALCPSDDCPGYLAFECCINPGGLSETINYVEKTTSYYNYCSGK